jgi:hypothetical protein
MVNIKWIVALCLTAVLAIVGWTVTGSLTIKLRTIDDLRNQQLSTQSNVSANNVRISVLENKYDTIQAALAEIKALLQAHIAK